MGALAVTHIMSSLLYGVCANDPVVFVSVPLLVCLISLLACYIPTRKAMKVNPLNALYYE
jgi:ABC-type lipoprotein release transport system permease subunit